VFDGGGDELVPVTLGHERHEQLTGRTRRESNDAPRSSTSAPTR
jgi:hypothetical protein